MNIRFLKTSLLLCLALVLMAFALPVSAQMSPAVEVADQVVVNGMVNVPKVVADAPSFIVIHKDNGEGSFGPVIGVRQLSIGENTNVMVAIDAAAATSTLYAMLHNDTGKVGVYEFGTVEGADGPVIVDGAPLSPAFNAAVMNVQDQFLRGNMYMAASVTVDAPSWLVIHADNEGRPGRVLGQTLVQAGTTADVEVTLDPDGITPVLFPMLHMDTGTVGTYEFGIVEGADAPIVINGAVATAPVWTVPYFRAMPQTVTLGDGMEMAAEPKFVVQSVLSEGPGFIVIHSEADGGPGPVAGYAAVQDGLNLNVEVTLDPAVVTPNLWPMLHVDTGIVGTYEFGIVQGADGPVRVNDAVLTSQVAAAPSIVYDVKQVSENQVQVASALIDASGWLVIHVDNNGAPGAVAGYALLTPGMNSNIVITVDTAIMTASVFPMLHYDTGTVGDYEFGEIEGADAPVRVGEAVVVGMAEVMPVE
jgi:hypothetical protein